MPTRTPRFNITGPALPRKVVSSAGTYGGGWKKIRNRHMAAEPLCRICASNNLVTLAVEVDHIRPKALGGLDDWANLQSLCHACHVTKTRQDVERIRRGY